MVLPKEVISRLQTADGEALFLIEVLDGGYQLTPYDPGFEKKMEKAEAHHQPLPQHTACPGQVRKPVWIDERDALALHSRLLALHGGGGRFTRSRAAAIGIGPP